MALAQVAVPGRLVAGTYVAEDAPNYWEARHGTTTAPIVLESVDGPGRAALPPINAFDVRHLYVLGVAITSEFDPFHCERCDHLLLRDVTLAGVPDGRSGDRPQETLKVNQSSNVFVEDSVISGATDNAVDFVAVQLGHLTGNRIGGAEDWCAYVKGGSALLTVEGNEFADCGTGGFTAGQGTGFQFMEPPWLTYEASDIRVINNIVHDVDGAAFGVAGASDTLIAYNTAYRIGERSHLIEVVLGRRGCDGAPDDANAVAACRAQLVRGGWGTTGEELEIIPNRNVWFYDNVLINPSDFPTPDVHFQVHGCVDARTSETNIPGPAFAADGLVLAGNVILNGAEDVALFDEVAGCGGAGSSCVAAKLRRDNTINVAGLALIDPGAADYCVGRVPAGAAAVWEYCCCHSGLPPRRLRGPVIGRVGCAVEQRRHHEPARRAPTRPGWSARGVLNRTETSPAAGRLAPDRVGTAGRRDKPQARRGAGFEAIRGGGLEAARRRRW